jgi:hypothetical protein
VFEEAMFVSVYAMIICAEMVWKSKDRVLAQCLSAFERFGSASLFLARPNVEGGVIFVPISRAAGYA